MGFCLWSLSLWPVSHPSPWKSPHLIPRHPWGASGVQAAAPRGDGHPPLVGPTACLRSPYKSPRKVLGPVLGFGALLS